METPGYNPPFIEAKKRGRSLWKLLLLFVILLILIPLSVGMVQVYQTITSLPKISPTAVPTTIAFPSDTPTPIASPTATMTPTPTPKGTTVDTRSGLDKSTLRVLVENGSGKTGAATKAAAALKLAGYTVIGTKNADAYDYVDITISIKAEKAAYLSLLKQDLSDIYTIADTRTTLDSSSEADAVVIVGN